MSLTETRICGAKLRDGTRCMNEPMPEKTRCRLHGGASTGAKTEEGRRRQSDAAKARWAEINEALAMMKTMGQESSEVRP